MLVFTYTENSYLTQILTFHIYAYFQYSMHPSGVLPLSFFLAQSTWNVINKTFSKMYEQNLCNKKMQLFQLFTKYKTHELNRIMKGKCAQ